MSGFLVAHKGFIGKIDIENNSSLIAHRFQIDAKAKQLITSGNFSWHCKTKLEIVTVSLVAETRTGCSAPTIVVRLCHAGNKTLYNSYCIVCVELDKEKVTPLKKFILHLQPDVLVLDDKNTCLFNGPSVAVCHRSEVSIFASFGKTVLKRYFYNFCSLKSLPLSIIHNCSRCLNNLKIKKADHLDHYCVGKKFLSFVTLTVSFKCENHQRYEKQIVQTLLFANETFTLIENHRLFPEEYIDCIGTLKLKHIELINDNFKSELFLGMSEGFVVHVVNGKMVNCINIFEDSSVQMLETGKTCAFQEDAILAGKTNAYAVLTNKLQVQKLHSGYQHVLTGDFIQNGCEQCLLLEDNNVEQSAWTLTDLHGTCYSSVDEASVVAASHVQSGLEATMKALTTKCQLEEISLYDAELGYQQRKDFIIDMFRKQKAALCNNSPYTLSSCQSNMVPLIVSKMVDRTSSETHSNIENIDVNVTDIWQRTYHGKWCIGVDIECMTSRPITMWIDVTLQEDTAHSTSVKSSIEVITPSKHSKTQNESMLGLKGSAFDFNHHLADTVTKSESSESCVPTDTVTKHGIENSGKIMSGASKQSDKSCDDRTKSEHLKKFSKTKSEPQKLFSRTLNCVLTLPPFRSSDILTGNVILNYQFGNYGVMEGFDGGLDDSGHVESARNKNKDLGNSLNAEVSSEVTTGHVGRLYTQCCGTVTLNASDVLDGQFEVNFDNHEASEDIFMENIKDSQRDRQAWLCMQYQHHIEVLGTPGTLCRLESLLTHQCQLFYQDKFDCYVSRYKSLSTVQIQLGDRTRDDRRALTVYTSCDDDLFLAVHLLYRHLPDCALILPKPVSQNATQTKCLNALQKEAEFLHSGLKELLNDTDSVQASDEMDDENDDIRKVGEKFKRRREKVLEKHNEFIGNDKVKHFIRQYRKIKHVTDSVVSSMD